MSDDITIPPEALEAAARAVHDIDRKIVGYDQWPPWEELSPADQRRRTHRAHAAIRAALSAWPGMSTGDARQWSVMPDIPIIILPLEKENSNAKT